MLAIIIIVVLPALFALPAHFGRDTNPVRYDIATLGTGGVALVAVDPYTERATVVRALP